MSRDYKNRATKKDSANIAIWKLGLALFLVALFAYFLFFLSRIPPEEGITKYTVTSKPKIIKKITKEKPIYSFYTILPNAEVIVPEFEMNTRSREKRIGKDNKTKKYVIQISSFRESEKADSLKAKLAMLGFISTIQRIQIGETIWNRVTMGAFTDSSSALEMFNNLKQKNIDSRIIESQ